MSVSEYGYKIRKCIAECLRASVQSPFPQIDIIKAMVIVWRVRPAHVVQCVRHSDAMCSRA